MTAGTPFTVTITAVDGTGATAASYNGTVNIDSTDVQGLFPGTVTLSGGVGSFQATLKTAGPQTISATDTLTPGIQGTSNNITVNAAAATRFTVSASPTTVTAGSTVTVTVEAFDAFNNRATGYTGTVTFTENDPAPRRPYRRITSSRPATKAFIPSIPVSSL